MVKMQCIKFRRNHYWKSVNVVIPDTIEKTYTIINGTQLAEIIL
jgi:hypothetical protein